MNTILLLSCAVVSMAISLTITIFYKRIRAKLWKDKYKLPDNIPLFPELEAIPDKNEFIQSSYLLDNAASSKDISREESVVDMLMTDESVLQSGFTLYGETLLLKCESPQRTTWHEIQSFPVIIGRSNDCDVCLADEKMADARHGLLFVKEGQYFYLDMNSIGGSIVDDNLAAGITRLKNGSCIQIHETIIHLIMQSNVM